jgi:hypothetical protein
VRELVEDVAEHGPLGCADSALQVLFDGADGPVPSRTGCGLVTVAPSCARTALPVERNVACRPDGRQADPALWFDETNEPVPRTPFCG